MRLDRYEWLCVIAILAGAGVILFSTSVDKLYYVYRVGHTAGTGVLQVGGTILGMFLFSYGIYNWTWWKKK